MHDGAPQSNLPSLQPDLPVSLCEHGALMMHRSTPQRQSHPLSLQPAPPVCLEYSFLPDQTQQLCPSAAPHPPSPDPDLPLPASLDRNANQQENELVGSYLVTSVPQILTNLFKNLQSSPSHKHLNCTLQVRCRCIVVSSCILKRRLASALNTFMELILGHTRLQHKHAKEDKRPLL